MAASGDVGIVYIYSENITYLNLQNQCPNSMLHVHVFYRSGRSSMLSDILPNCCF